jgi:O-antigen/teichoic acid export membrane protein
VAAEAGTRVATARSGRSRITAPWRSRARAIRRLGWGVVDQAVSSLTNFAVSIYVVSTLGAAQFGAFSLAYVTYSFALNASRGLASDPLMIRYSGVEFRRWRRGAADCTGTSLTVGLVTGILVLGAAEALQGSAKGAFVALGLTMPGLMLQDGWRYAFFAQGRGVHAFLNDLIWAATLLPALVAVKLTGHANVFWFMLAWGLTANVAAAVGPLQARVRPNVAGVLHWLHMHRDLGFRYFIEGTSNSASAQLRTYGLGLFLGLSAVGDVQASVTLMGPITIMFLGMALVMVPEAVRVLRSSPKRLPLFCVVISAGLAAVALAWGVVLLVALPRGLGEMLLKSTWRDTLPLVMPQIYFVLGQAVAGGAGAGLHALGAAKRSVRGAVFSAVLCLVLSLLGAWRWGASGCVYGLAIATWMTALLWWWQFRAALRDAGVMQRGNARPSGHAAGRHRRSTNYLRNQRSQAE